MYIISSDHRKLFVSLCWNILIVGSSLDQDTTENLFKALMGHSCDFFGVTKSSPLRAPSKITKTSIQGTELSFLRGGQK